MINLDEAPNSLNLAESFSNEDLSKLGAELCSYIKNDDQSRSEWLDRQHDWLMLAAQITQDKSYPWPDSANVKYPLLTLAAIQFHARALPALVDTRGPVKCKVVGGDPKGVKRKRGDRVAKYMSYQVLEQMDDWLDETDRLLFVLPIIGLCFKKTFYSDAAKKIKSVTILPSDLIINYGAQDYYRARMTQRIFLDVNEIQEYVNQGLFLPAQPLNQLPNQEPLEERDETLGLTNIHDTSIEEFYESHCWLDLDEDGYKEPYIVTVRAADNKVVRIVARWEQGGVERDINNKLIRITATQYFTAYQFLPDPNSKVYGLGFGTLIGPINETVNTVINQLLDAGTMSNLQCGFIAKSVKIKSGDTNFQPGEWKQAQTTSDDLRKGIVPLPTREPSAVLFNLLGMMRDAGQQIGSVNEMMLGNNPGQNTPATTSMAMIDQGEKVFSGIFKRTHRSLGREFKAIYEINRIYLDEADYQEVLDWAEPDVRMLSQLPPEEQQMVIQQAKEDKPSLEDFSEKGYDIIPTSDSSMVSDAQKLMRAEGLMQLMQAGMPVNPAEVTRRVVEAQGHEDIDKLLAMPPPPPNLDMLQLELETAKAQIQALVGWTQAIKNIADAEAVEPGQQMQMYSDLVDKHIQITQLEKANADRAQQNSGA